MAVAAASSAIDPAVVARDRWLAVRDGHVDRRGVRAAVAVVDRVGERVRSELTGGRLVGQSVTAAGDDDRALGAVGLAGDRERVAGIGVRVVAEDVDRGGPGGRADRLGVVDGHGRVLDRVDRHGDACRVGAAVAVRDRVGERVAAGGVGGRPIGQAGPAAGDRRRRPSPRPSCP